MEGTILFVILIALWGYWCYRIAEKNGRSRGLAVFMGLIFGLLAVIVYYIVGATKDMKLKRAEELIAENKKK